MKKYIALSFFGALAYAVGQWGVIAILARAGSPADMGGYIVALAITAPTYLFFSLNLKQYQASCSESDIKFSEFMKIRKIGVALASLLSVIVGLFYGLDVMVIVVLVSLIRLFEFKGEIFLGMAQREQNFKFIFLSKLIRSLVLLLPFCTVYLIFGNMLIALLGSAIMSASVYVFIEKKYKIREFTPSNSRINLDTFKVVISVLPLGLSSTFDSLIANFPRLFLAKVYSIEDAGVYAALAYFIVPIGMVASAIGQPLIPKLAQGNKNQDEVSRLVKDAFFYLLLFVVPYVGAVLISPEKILQTLYGIGGEGKVTALRILMVGGVMWAIAGILSCILIGKAMYRAQLLTTIIGLLASIVIATIYMPGQSLSFGAVVFCVGMFSRLLASFLILTFTK